jgi:hypothetical protein
MNGTGSEKVRKVPMLDLWFIGLTVAFFAIAGLYVRFCEKL